jgi:hypothetical protein
VPSKVYGCLAAGRPVIFIGDAAGEVARLLTGDEVGFTCPIGQAQRLASLIQQISEPGVSQLMGAKARKSFQLGYDMPARLAQFEALLSSTCAHPNTAERADR